MLFRGQSEGSNQDQSDCYWTIPFARHCLFLWLYCYVFANIAFHKGFTAMFQTTINKTVVQSNVGKHVAIKPYKK